MCKVIIECCSISIMPMPVCFTKPKKMTLHLVFFPQNLVSTHRVSCIYKAWRHNCIVTHFIIFSMHIHHMMNFKKINCVGFVCCCFSKWLDFLFLWRLTLEFGGAFFIAWQKMGGIWLVSSVKHKDSTTLYGGRVDTVWSN